MKYDVILHYFLQVFHTSSCTVIFPSVSYFTMAWKDFPCSLKWREFWIFLEVVDSWSLEVFFSFFETSHKLSWKKSFLFRIFIKMLGSSSLLCSWHLIRKTTILMQSNFSHIISCKLESSSAWFLWSGHCISCAVLKPRCKNNVIVTVTKWEMFSTAERYCKVFHREAQWCS